MFLFDLRIYFILLSLSSLSLFLSSQVLITAENHQPLPYAGGFAIDDIRFDNCAYDMYTPVPCEDGEAKCDSGQCYPMDNMCDFTKDCCTDNTDETDCCKYNVLVIFLLLTQYPILIDANRFYGQCHLYGGQRWHMQRAALEGWPQRTPDQKVNEETRKKI